MEVIMNKLTRSKKERFISFKELLPRILVKDPVIHDSWDMGKFTTYLICIKTEHPAFHLRLSAVRRRYSDLRWLYKTMTVNHPHIHFPKPPPKKVFSERFEEEFIKSRMSEIQEFLNQLLVTDTVLSDAAFHFFVQTDLTPHEIQGYLDGSLSETFVKEAWENAGHLHSSSYIVNTTTIPHVPQEIIMNEEDLQSYQQTSRYLNSSGSDSSSSNSTLNVNSAVDVPKYNNTMSGLVVNSATIVPEVNGSESTPEVNHADSEVNHADSEANHADSEANQADSKVSQADSGAERQQFIITA